MDYPRAIFLNFDKAGAEWTVVAYLSGDARMLDVVQSGKSPHTVTGSLISGAPEDLVAQEHKAIGDLNIPQEIEAIRQSQFPNLLAGNYFLPRSMSIRQAGKKSNHALNYGEGYRVFALQNEMEETEARQIVDYYLTKAYPGIPLWQEAIRRELKNNHRVLTNCFQQKVTLRGAWDSFLWKAAYAFKPQSTVVHMVNRGMMEWYRAEDPYLRNFDLRTQVHDSLLAQFWLDGSPDQFYNLARSVRFIDSAISPLCCYNQRDFTIRTDAKIGLNWQTMYPFPLADNLDEQVRILEEAVDRLFGPSGDVSTKLPGDIPLVVGL